MNLELLATFTVFEFRQFRKALAVLQRAGLDTSMAIDLLLKAALDNRRYLEMRAQARRDDMLEAALQSRKH